MPSERIQRQTDRLLDEAEAGVAQQEWNVVRERALHVLTIDPENEDARAFLAIAERGRAGPEVAPSPGDPASSAITPMPAAPALAVPSAFVSGRYRDERSGR